ncbi:MAG: FtsX-like permease family protein [Calditrichaeota bacterium]|nr:MAG: FtsX-like permease family protein [Calditrichota bacterium]
MNQFADTVREVFHYFRQYRARTFMTLFGLIWGTMTVVLLLSFGNGVEKAMKKNMHGMGDGIAILWPGTTTKAWQGYNRGRNLRFRVDDVELLRREINEFEAISGEYIYYDRPTRYADHIAKAPVTGVMPEYGPMRNIIAREGGRWLNDLDMENKRRVVFLGFGIRNLLFGENGDAVGKYVYIGETPFQVIGVLEKKTQPSSYAYRDEDRVFIPLTTFESLYGWRYLSNVVYKIQDPTHNKVIENRIYEVLGKRFKFDPTDRNALGVWDTTEMDKFIYYFSLGFKLFLGLIGVITLVVGGIGLANIMYVVVQERTLEIGIKRSIGAKRRMIMSQFLTEAFLIISIGAGVGFCLALVLIKLISLLPIEEYVGHPQLSWAVAFASIAILSIIGFLAGYFPARKASRLKVVECLRY